MSSRALQFLGPAKVAAVLPLLERNLAKFSAQKAATPPAVRLCIPHSCSLSVSECVLIY